MSDNSMLIDKSESDTGSKAVEQDIFPFFPKQTEAEEFIGSMHIYLLDKIFFQSLPCTITEPEKVFFICSDIINCIKTDGFGEAFAHLVVDADNEECEAAFRTIGADKMADIVANALRMADSLSDEYFDDPASFLEQSENKEAAASFGQLSSEYAACLTETKELLYRYANENKDSFEE